MERRKSVAFFPPREGHPFAQGDLHMLREDIHHRVMPIGHRTENWPDYRVTVEPFSEAASECFLTALSVDERGYDLESVLRNFVWRAVDLILYQGEAFFELVFDADDEPKGFLLAPLPPGQVNVFEGTVTQIIPREVQMARGLAQPFIELPESDVLHFTFPDSLGGKAGITGLTAELEQLGGSVLPQFAEGDFAGMVREFGFNVGEEYRELRFVALGRATARLGWNGRSLWDEKTTEFYKMYRTLKFSHSMCVLREHTVRCLNSFLGARVMRRVGLEGTLTVTGIPNSKDLEAKLGELLEGKLGFGDSLKYIYL